jgi:hypothetical protein
MSAMDPTHPAMSGILLYVRGALIGLLTYFELRQSCRFRMGAACISEAWRSTPALGLKVDGARRLVRSWGLVDRRVRGRAAGRGTTRLAL